MNKIEKVEWYSVGGVCDKDLTGSCHIVVVTYENLIRKIIQLEAGFWQRPETRHRNALFPKILFEIAPGCIILSHEHLDHAGRLVPMVKALLEKHKLAGIPVIMSEASRELLPHVLRAIHQINEDSLHGFDQDVSRFESKWSSFSREYEKKPSSAPKSRSDHRPEGERRAEKKRENEVTIIGLKRSFEEWGGYINEKSGEMIIPAGTKKGDIGRLHQIIREIKRLSQPENSGALSTQESNCFENMKTALAKLFLGGEIFETIDDIFSKELPRHERKNRSDRIKKAKIVIDKAIELKRETLLPDISKEDIDRCVLNGVGKQTEEEFAIPGLPGVSGVLHHAGHVLGSVSVELIFDMVGSRTERLLFSGDIGSWNKPTIHGRPQLPQHTVSKLIMESTYAGKRHIELEPEIDKIVEFIKTHKGPILMPVFAFDRLFVVLHALRDKIISGEIDCPIFCRNRLGEVTEGIYADNYPQLKEVLSRITILSGPGGGAEAYDLMGSDKHCLILASGGTLIESSSAHGLLQYRAETGKPIYMVFTGYQPGELGARIMEFIKYPDSGSTVEMQIGVQTAELKKENLLLTGGFSGHADTDDLGRLSRIGDDIFLIHGDPENALILAAEIGATILEREKYTRIF